MYFNATKSTFAGGVVLAGPALPIRCIVVEYGPHEIGDGYTSTYWRISDGRKTAEFLSWDEVLAAAASAICGGHYRHLETPEEREQREVRQQDAYADQSKW